MVEEFLELTNTEELITILEKYISPKLFADQEKVILEEAKDRILAETLKAGEDLPPFSRSAVDGYAARAEDTFGANPNMPVYLQVKKEIKMGKSPDFSLSPGQVAAIPTGGMLPEEADCCIMIEDTEEIREGQIEVMAALAPGENVIKKGDDIKAEEILLPAGKKLAAAGIGALAGLGIARVPVFSQPEVAIISTGNELIPPQEERKLGQIRDINSYALAALLAEWGFKSQIYGIVKDEKETLKKAIEESLDKDLVVLSGGSSVGVKDLTIDTINELGEPGVILHGLAVKPGKPTVLGILCQKPIIGLPGNPSSALVVASLLIPAILHLGRGLALPEKDEIYQEAITANLAAPIFSDSGREEFFPVSLSRSYSQEEKKKINFASPIAGKSNLITTLVNSADVVRIPRGHEGLSAGSRVEVIKLTDNKGLLFRKERDNND